MTSPLKNLHEGSGRRDLSYELAAHTKRLEEQVAETCPKIQTGLNSWEYSQRLTLVPATRF